MRWTTIGLSAGQQYAETSEPARPKPDRKAKIASVWIPAVLGLGLLTVFAYLGVRIVAAKSAGPSVTASPEPPRPSQMKAGPPEIKAATSEAPTAGVKPPVLSTPAQPVRPDFSVISPQAGEMYLQIAAVNPHVVLKYVDDLHKMDLDAVVAPGPTPDQLRILLGPFADRDSIDQAKARLESSGKHPFIRIY